MSKKIELLSPARDLNCGIEAILHGADAVYIGAPKFGARAAAGNSIKDIQILCDYAHLFGVRIYVTLNTILKDEELLEAEHLISQLYFVGVDALIIQDMGITMMDIPPIPLHASTQTDNRTAEKVKFLQSVGFTQVVLARELSLSEIKTIAENTTVALEVFIHGALCVSLSGQCYMSAAMTGRSANRGECAQCCRLPYSLLDVDGKVVFSDKYLLSLKDMNRSNALEQLLDVGVTSLKIEGRLKDVSYVKNVTAFYRSRLDEIFAKRSDFVRSSDGLSSLSFIPNVEKSFNRGFTSYFLNGRSADITSFDTPKSIGEPIGKVKEIRNNSFFVDTKKTLNNSDGIVFLNKEGSFDGCRINRVESNQLFPVEMPALAVGTMIYRNYNQLFEKQLTRQTAERKIKVEMVFSDNAFGFTLSLFDETGSHVMVTILFQKELARSSQEDNIKTQLAKLGGTIFCADDIKIHMSDNWFIPSSLLSDLRRKAIDRLMSVRRIRYPKELAKIKRADNTPYIDTSLTYLGNVANKKAENFYYQHGVNTIEQAFELKPQREATLMFTKHCLLYSMGICVKNQLSSSSFHQPYFLVYKDLKYRLKFDCSNCQMLIAKENK